MILHRDAIKYPSDGSPLIGPEKRRKKAIRTKNCLSVASFFVPLFSEHRRNRPIVGVAFFWATFFGEAKKVAAPRHKRDRGTPTTSFDEPPSP